MNRQFSIILLTITLLTTLFITATTAMAQVSGKETKVPPFGMLQTNGKVFRAQQLPVNKPILIIYFSPDCDHCQKLMNNIFKQVKDFQKASIAMITFQPLDKVAAFERSYGIIKHPNIYLGTEGTSFFVRKYYNITDMPFIALHDKSGNLVKSYNRDANLNDISTKLNNLK